MCRDRRARLLCALTAVVTSACSESDPLYRLCTEIGCSSGLHITFDAAPPPGTIVQAEPSGGLPWRVECGVQVSCDNGVFFPDFMPDYVRVRITTPAGEILHEVRPEYEAVMPNGADCPPTCRTATVEVELP